MNSPWPAQVVRCKLSRNPLASGYTRTPASSARTGRTHSRFSALAKRARRGLVAAKTLLTERLLVVTATLAPNCIRPGLHGVRGRLRLRITLHQALHLVLDFGRDLRFPQPIQGYDAVRKPRRDLPGDWILDGAV